KPGKRASSIIITLSDYTIAKQITMYGLFIENAVCPGHWFWPGPDQCFKCQQYGHKSYRCPSPHPICACCADSHDTQKC
ncbi:hypothetical protein IW262DRAFT_1253900, partial [Armillaria fumosa]